MPALLCGSWRASICFCACVGTMNWFVLVLVVLLVLENVQTGWVVEDEHESEEEDEWPGSWKVSICFRTRMGTMNWFVLVLVLLLVLENVQTGWVVEDEDESEEEDEWPGSWVASICFRTRIGTTNWFVLVLVLLLVLENVQTGWVVEDENENEE